ncbi:MAG: branched-chain amino acid ABC transporter permease [Caldilineaceae bacterium]|nr:branched-chain amino acid ABC transporter permease [Caldilineaceae bacterium]
MIFDPAGTTITLLTLFGIAAMIALSLNLEYGLAGIPNFGKALFVSIGAYTAGVTYTRLLPLLAGREAINPCGATMGQALQLRSEILRTMPAVALANFGITLLIAILLGGLVGYLAAYPALRLKDEWYLGLVLLAGSEVVRIIVRGTEPIICAYNGVSGISQPFVWLPTPQAKAGAFAVLTLVLAGLFYLYSRRLVQSPYGRVLKAMRENSDVATALGKPMARLRAQTMVIGSAMAAVAGVFFVTNIGFASANDYGVGLTLDIWVMIVLGGLGNMRGALLGALLVTLLDRITAVSAIQLNMLGSSLEFNYVRYILFGIILLIMLRFRTQGLLPEPANTTRASSLVSHTERRRGEVQSLTEG